MRATTLFSIAILVAAITVPMPPAMANDTDVELATGGLVFTKNPNVVMREEDLFISMAEVRVRYVFFNSTAKDITNVGQSILLCEASFQKGPADALSDGGVFRFERPN
jgi:hypothetical protein